MRSPLGIRSRRYLVRAGQLATGFRSFISTAARETAMLARAAVIEETYRRRRRKYSELARHNPTERNSARPATERTRRRLAAMGISATPKQLGSVHTLACFPMIGWHPQLLPPLHRLGKVSHFDLVAAGIDYSRLFGLKREALRQRKTANEAFVAFAKRATQEVPVDWVYVYASGLELLSSTLAEVRAVTKAPIVGMCLDDKQSWEFPVFGEQRPGQIDIAPQLDIAWTSARVACDWYFVEGGNPVFLPEGCSPDLFLPGHRQDVDICFVGAAYGFRRHFVDHLRRNGLNVTTAGSGWEQGPLSEAEMVRLMQRSKIILGMGGIGWSEQLKNVKGRDFDAPCVGSAAYVTSFNPDLADFYEIGREIACYSSRDEAVEVCAELIRSEEKRLSLAAAGRSRCLRDHTWDSRFATILRLLGVLEDASGERTVGG